MVTDLNKTIVHITGAELGNIPEMVLLSDQKRRSYEGVQPKFWKQAPDANPIQEEWFATLIQDKNTFMKVAKKGENIVGFIIGQLVRAPAVYNPGGLTLMIDDFCVQHSSHWESVGNELFKALKKEAYAQGAVQTLIVCGAHDEPKRKFLQNLSMNIASEWYVG